MLNRRLTDKNSFHGYVLGLELCKKAKVSNTLFSQFENIVMKHMGKYVAIRKDSIPDKYKEAANKCQDLGDYLSLSYLNDLIGCTQNHLAVLENQKKVKFDGINIGRIRLIKMPEKFISLWNRGKTPFYIDRSSKEYADEIVKMQHIEIGFY